jgi:LmbE family N-acetylglucosaminyl deacetylase
MNTILFIFAHPDDESYGPAGTISQLADDPNNNVIVVSLCKGNRPSAERVSSARIDAFNEACSILNATPIIYDQSDCDMDYNKTLKVIESLITTWKPSSVYTHNISDIHKDHRLVSELCLVACRPKTDSSVNELYMTELPSSTDWSFGQIEPVFVPNYYVDVTDKIVLKQRVMSLYATEIYNYPDCRSIESMEALAMYRGKQIAVHRAEAFKQVFRRC